MCYIDGRKNNYSELPMNRSSCPVRVTVFILSTSSRSSLGPTEPPNQEVPVVLSMGVKWTRGKADHSPPTSVKITWIYTATQPYVFMACISGGRIVNPRTLHAAVARGSSERDASSSPEWLSQNSDCGIVYVTLATGRADWMQASR
jgi:hypothetical protein